MVDIGKLGACMLLKKERREKAVLDAEDEKVLERFDLKKLPKRLVEKLVLKCQNELNVRNQAEEVNMDSTNLHEHRRKMQESSAGKMPPTRPLWLPVMPSQTVQSPGWFNDLECLSAVTVSSTGAKNLLQGDLKRVEKPQRQKATPNEVSTVLTGMSSRTRETLWEAGTKPENRPPQRRVGRMLWYETEFPVVKK